MKRLGDVPRSKLGHDPDPSETGNNQTRCRTTRSGDEQRFGELVRFLGGFVDELNRLSSEGWAVLVEGQRDARALRSIGCRGRILTMRSAGRRRAGASGRPKGIVILTDSDREGRQLAARCARELALEGVPFSLDHRRRLLAASGGVFRHVENLVRFSDALGVRSTKREFIFP